MSPGDTCSLGDACRIPRLLVEDVVIRPVTEGDADAIVQLWTDCELVRPWNDPFKDISRKLAHSPDWFFVATQTDRIVGSVMVGYDGHRGWVNYLAVAPTSRRCGLGSRLMLKAEQVLFDAGCPKVNLQVRSSNSRIIAFYQAQNYEHDDCLSLGKRLVFDA